MYIYTHVCVCIYVCIYIHTLSLFYSFLFNVFKNWIVKLNKAMAFSFLEELKSFWQNPALSHVTFMLQIKKTYFKVLISFYNTPPRAYLAQCRLSKCSSPWTQEYLDLSIISDRASSCCILAEMWVLTKLVGSQKVIQPQVAWGPIPSFMNYSQLPALKPSSLLCAPGPFSVASGPEVVNW